MTGRQRSSDGGGAAAARQNEYFVPRDGINREVITADICRYLGNNALVRPGNYQDDNTGRTLQGYYITAYRNLTTSMIDDLRNDSARWEQERRKHSPGAIRYQDSNIYRPAGMSPGTASGEAGSAPSYPGLDVPAYGAFSHGQLGGYSANTPAIRYAADRMGGYGAYAATMQPGYTSGYIVAATESGPSSLGCSMDTSPYTDPVPMAMRYEVQDTLNPLNAQAPNSGYGTWDYDAPGNAVAAELQPQDTFYGRAEPRYSYATQADNALDDPFVAPPPEQDKIWGRERARPAREKPAAPPPPAIPVEASGSMYSSSTLPDSVIKDSSCACPVCRAWPCACGTERKDGKDPYSGTGLVPQG